MEQPQTRLLILLAELERQLFLLQKSYSALYLMEDVTNSSQDLYDAATNRALNNATAAFSHFTWICNEQIRQVRNEIQQLLQNQVDAVGWR